ncbi:MAG: hypothetical protein PUC53_04950 [Bacteroidales bacterium]|nr:hypothetical protein [Bacteroidales bacterium]
MLNLLIIKYLFPIVHHLPSFTGRRLPSPTEHFLQWLTIEAKASKSD